MKCRAFALLLIPGLFAAAYGAGPEGNFKDPNLDAIVRKFLPPEVKPGAPWTPELLAKVTLVSAEISGVRDLGGLEACPNVAFIFLTGAQVTDLAPLAKLNKLEGVTIRGGKIQNLAPLAGLPKLQYLDFESNEISDLKPLATMKWLTHLDLAHNRVVDLSPLAELTALEELNLNGNQISDLKPLAGLGELHALYLDQNKISDAGPLVAMAQPDPKAPERVTQYRVVSLVGNPLSASAKTAEVAELQKYGLHVLADAK